jgi:hypothetical protein
MMRLPSFYERVPKLRVHDPLAEVLGSAEGGILEYGYGDVVRLAGHSCPTVASAYWLTFLALADLYPDRLPERGGVRVEFRDDVHSGANGVAASVVQMLTGAAGDGGFKGIGGRYARAGLQRFAPELPLAMRFTRLDNGAAVDAQADLSLLPVDPELSLLLAQCAFSRGDANALPRLGELWQRRVECLLVERAEDRGIFVLRRGVLRHTSPISASA